MTKRTNCFYLLLIVAIALAGLSSCQKWDTFNDIDPNTRRVIAEFTDGKTGGSVAMDFSNEVITVDLTELRLFTRSWAKEAAKVKVVNDPTVVADYNAENGTGYTAVPSGAFSFESDELTLTESDRKKVVQIKIKPSILLGGSYAIGLAIAEVNDGEVSQLAGKVMIAVSVKNKYDGVYRVTGSCVDALGVYTGIYPLDDVELRTAGANSVDYLDPTYTVGPPFFNNLYIIENIATGAPAWLYSPRFVFNTTTDKATDILDTDGLVPFGTISPAGPNQFTINSPSDKQFAIKYTAIGGRFTITENWTFTRSR